jgi:hypothetical protein
MGEMQDVKSYQYAQLSVDRESVTMIPIRKNMPMSPASTEALTAVAAVAPCMQVGGNCFEDENEWQHIMEDHTPRDQDRQEMVHEARDQELAKDTVEGRAFVVSLHSSMTKSAEQARAFGKALLLWCAQHSAVNREQDTAGWHGGTGGTYDGATTGGRGVLAATRRNVQTLPGGVLSAKAKDPTDDPAELHVLF